MKQTRRLLSASAVGLGALLLGVTSCSKDDNNGVTAPTTGSDTLSATISASRTLVTGKTYYLNGVVFVSNNSTLTIQPGVIIKAIKGTKATLVVTKGAKIDAQGTASQPIVFTSNQPAGSRSKGDWGGVVLVGNGITNYTYNGTKGRRILEGFDQAEIAAYGSNIVGGGDNNADNSGSLRYVRIEFAGIPLSSQSNSELNGLTLLCTGSGTTLDHIQVSYSGDDSFEWFGGAVNAKYLIAYRGVDDDFDTDNGYVGKVQFGLAIRDNAIFDVGTAASNGFESDNEDPVPATLSTPLTAPVFSNMTFIGPGAFAGIANINAAFGRAALLRRGTQLSVYNSVFLGWANGINIDGTNSNEWAANGQMEFKNNVVAGFSVGKYIYATNGAAGANPAATFMAAANANDTSYSNIADLKFTSLALSTSLDARPATGSPLLNKASFTATKLAGFTNVAYVGALANGDTWMNGWVELDPQNKAY